MRGGRLIAIVMVVAALGGIALAMALRHQTLQMREREQQRQQQTAPR